MTCPITYMLNKYICISYNVYPVHRWLLLFPTVFHDYGFLDYIPNWKKKKKEKDSVIKLRHALEFIENSSLLCIQAALCLAPASEIPAINHRDVAVFQAHNLKLRTHWAAWQDLLPPPSQLFRPFSKDQKKNVLLHVGAGLPLRGHVSRAASKPFRQPLSSSRPLRVNH